MKSRHNVDTVLDLMREYDRRYDENRKCDQDAVKLAKEAADEAKGKVNILTLISVLAALTGFISIALNLADRLK